MELDDPALRRGATGKLAHALKLAEELRSDMDAWWASGPTTLALDLHDDRRTIDLVARTGPLPPVDDWYHRAADIMQNYRDALNRLAYSIGYVYSAPSKPRDGSFPMRRDTQGWEDWKKKQLTLPDFLIDRFYAFQPFISGREFLLALTASNNIEKHEGGFLFSITLTGLQMGPGTMTVEGLWNDDNLGEGLRLTAGETPDILTERQVMGTIEMPTPVLDLGEVDVRTDFAFTPMMRFDDQEIPLLGAIDLIGREVAWAIAYITGIAESATNPPDHFDL